MAYINGSSSGDLILGTDFRDVIMARGGADEVYGYGGDDDIYGGSGNDVLYGGSGWDFLIGGQGVNDLYGGSGADTFVMSARGAGFSDDWVGDFQFDVDAIDVSQWGVSDFSQLRNLFRTDSYGNAWLDAKYDGYDHYLTIDGVRAWELIASDFIYDTGGSVSLLGTAYADTLFGSRQNDVLNGLGGHDVLLGGQGNDTIRGAFGADRLYGGAGADLLRGDRGTDRLTGEGGADRFDFNSVLDSRPGAARDIITDFTHGVDVIDLAGIDADAAVAGNQAFTWIADADLAAAGQLNYRYAGGSTIISGNVDGDPAADFQIRLLGHIALTAGDFAL